MKIGYARVSTDDQNLDLQIHALKQQGCTKIFEEKITGKKRNRPALDQALAAVKKGDVLVVWKLDRLGRSLQDLIEIVGSLQKRNVDFHSISNLIDTTNPTGRLLFHILGALAEFECSLISERTKAGMQAARRKGVKLGRPKCMNGMQLADALLMSSFENLTLKDIAERLGVSRSTLRRAMA